MVKSERMEKLKIVAIPATLAIVTGVLYALARPLISTLISGDEGAMTSGMIAFLGTLYAIVGGFCVFEVLKQWNAVFEAYSTHDKRLYDGNVGKKLPWHLKVAWGSTSILLVAAFVLTYWHNVVPAIFAVVSVTFCTSFWWIVAMDLDDYHTGYWNIPEPKQDWWK